MEFFAETKKRRDAASILSELFKTYKESSSSASRYLSPSSLSCQVACAFKLQGVPTEPSKDSFQSASFADAGEDRHRRIQGFLSHTPYWVDVSKYVSERSDLEVRVVTVEERVSDYRHYNEERLKSLLDYKTGMAMVPEEIVKEIDDLDTWLHTEDAIHCRKMYQDDPYETLLVHKTLPIRFKCDGILYIEGNYYILEIKTERNSINIFRTTYDDKHQLQGISYSALLKINEILWVYEGRDSLEQKVFIQSVSDSQHASMLNRFRFIVDNKDNVSVLERDLKACTYCPYKKHCRQTFKVLKKEVKDD